MFLLSTECRGRPLCGPIKAETDRYGNKHRRRSLFTAKSPQEVHTSVPHEIENAVPTREEKMSFIVSEERGGAEVSLLKDYHLS